MRDLLKELKEQLDDSPELQPFTDIDSPEFDEMKKRVACLLCSEPKETFGIYDDDIDNFEAKSEDQHQAILGKISETLGDLLEDMDIPVETVDSLKVIFMVLNPSNIKMNGE